MPIDIKKTKEYYENTAGAQVCSCEDCQNYAANIKAAYPELDAYLASLGAAIAKPFETIPLHADNGLVHFFAAQYILLGSSDDFKRVSVSGFDINTTEDHPVTSVEEEHFVIEISGEIRVPHTVFLEYPEEKNEIFFAKLIRKIKK